MPRKHVLPEDIQRALDLMTKIDESGGKIEIRGFGPRPAELVNRFDIAELCGEVADPTAKGVHGKRPGAQESEREKPTYICRPGGHELTE
jgi:hypothetical protein